MFDYVLLRHKLGECIDVLFDDDCNIDEDKKDELNNEIQNIIDKLGGEIY